MTFKLWYWNRDDDTGRMRYDLDLPVKEGQEVGVQYISSGELWNVKLPEKDRFDGLDIDVEIAFAGKLITETQAVQEYH